MRYCEVGACTNQAAWRDRATQVAYCYGHKEKLVQEHTKNENDFVSLVFEPKPEPSK